MVCQQHLEKGLSSFVCTQLNGFKFCSYLLYFQIEAGNDAACVTVYAFYTIWSLWGFCWSLSIGLLSIHIGDLVLDDEGTASNLAGAV